MTIIEWTEVLGNVGEFVGSIVVLATLVYLAIQVKQSKELLERQEKIALSQVYQERAIKNAETQVLIASSDDLLETAMIGFSVDAADQINELTPLQKMRATLVATATMHFNDNAVYQHELGRLDEHAFEFAVGEINTFAPVWLELDIPVTERVMSVFTEHKEQQSRLPLRSGQENQRDSDH